MVRQRFGHNLRQASTANETDEMKDLDVRRSWGVDAASVAQA
jgi:hypothetical protein